MPLLAVRQALGVDTSVFKEPKEALNMAAFAGPADRVIQGYLPLLTREEHVHFFRDQFSHRAGRPTQRTSSC